jgi:hypothetical protein
MKLNRDKKNHRNKRKGSKPTDLTPLDGVVTFYGSHHALKAESVLKKEGLRAVLIPGPREISPNCGVALRFEYVYREKAVKIFNEYYVHFEDIHLYPVK